LLTYRVGASASPAAGVAMAKYLTTETLKPEHQALAQYYAGETPPLPTSLLEELAQGLNQGDVGYGEALDELVRAEVALIPREQTIDVDAIKARIEEELATAAMRDSIAREIAAQGGTVAELRPDLSPALAERLGITDPDRPLTESGIAHLLNGRRLDGGEIAGKEVHKPRMSIAEIFGLDPKMPVNGEAMRNVLAGNRADGEVPASSNGRALEQKIVDGAGKRFRAAMGVPAHRDATPAEVAHLVAGRTATGGMVDAKDYRRQIHATRPPVGFVDLTFSADKSLSAAWAMAPTEAERAALLDIHKHAVADAMAYVEERIGFARKGAGGKGGVEAGKLGWISFQHYTARPAVDIVRTDKEGRAYTDPREVPLQTADPQLHTHATMFNAVLTESGRLGSLDLDRLDGFVKEGGAIYQAAAATRARRAGIIVVLDDKTGAARLADVPGSVREMFSKRSREALSAARALAKEKGANWDSLSGDQQVALIKAGADETRNAKDKRSLAGEGQSDFAVWREQAEAAGYRHRSVLRPDEIKPDLSPDQRRAMAYEVSQPLIEHEFGQRARLDGQDLRVMAARGLIASGIGDRPGNDIAAVLKAYGRHGVRQDGTQTAITLGKEAPLRGKDRWSVTTSLHEAQERELIGLARDAVADTSAALSTLQIDQAADTFLARNPGIDPAGTHWQAQRSMMQRLATGGRLGVGIGAAGAGKSTILAGLVDAWKADGRQVFGATVAWRQATDLGAAGIAPQDRAALAPFLKGVEQGRYALDRNSVVVVDEVGLVGTRQQLELMRLQKKHGFQLVQLGDEKQCQSVEAGPVIELMRTAIGEDHIPQILTSIRQKTEREREITGLFRDGKAAEALEMKREDGTALLVAGGWDATVQCVARLWHDRMEANKDNPDFRLTVSAETNAAAREIGTAIRAIRRETGQLAAEEVEVAAMDRSGATNKLVLAAGDKVRLFDRVHDAETPGRAKVLGNNGEVVEVRRVSEKGMVVRNAAGDEGLVAWAKLRERAGEPVRLSYGYAATVNVSQGVTSTEHIHASVSSHGLTAYTALSRHERASWLVVDEASVRQRVHAANLKAGHAQTIRIPDVWARLGEELSQQPIKASAVDMLSRVTELRRGSVAGFQRTMAGAERTQETPGPHLSQYERARLALSPVLRQVVGYAREVKQRLRQGVTRSQDMRAGQAVERQGPNPDDEYRGPGMRL
jgi:TrwC relaxase/AAA domain